MDLLIGTRDGIHTLDGSAPLAAPGRHIRDIAPSGEGHWVLSDDGVVSRLVGSELFDTATIADLRTHCVHETHDDVLVGGAEASLFRVDPDVPTIETFVKTVCEVVPNP